MTDHNNAAIELRNRKRQLRQSAELLRQKIKPQHPDAGARVVQHLLQDLRSKDPATWTAGAVVSSYHQRGSEMDMTDLNAALVEAGYDLALPVVLGRGHPLAFRRYRPGDDLTKGVLEVMEPLPTAPILVPKILLLPLLAFDRQGNRLGYGGGYYDRTVALLRREASILAIGIAFAQQECPDIPVGGTDAPLDWIVTEQECLYCANATHS
ncbi:MAG: 5-formyltetrahydrofolate cyclo-ligase [Alphaproteobacteria bacterium]|nr:5-formyltetrahydrofolate cyclo-ligase [Alphaproteobacteria bacterium]